MAGQDFRPGNSHPQAWACPLSVPEIRSLDKSEVITVTYGAPWSGVGLSLQYPAFSLCVLLPRDPLGGLSYILWRVRCDERNREPEGVSANRTVGASRVLLPPNGAKLRFIKLEPYHQGVP